MKSTVKLLAAIVLAGCVDARANPVGISANQIRTAAPGALTLSGVAAAEGTSQAICRADHAHSIAGILPMANGGTGAAAQNFVDLTTDQSIAGVKTFTTKVVVTSSTPGVAAITGNGNGAGSGVVGVGGSGFLIHSPGVQGTGGTSGPGGLFTAGAGQWSGVIGLGAGASSPGATSAGGYFAGASAGGPGAIGQGAGAFPGFSGTGGAGASGLVGNGGTGNNAGVLGNGSGSGAGLYGVGGGGGGGGYGVYGLSGGTAQPGVYGDGNGIGPGVYGLGGVVGLGVGAVQGGVFVAGGGATPTTGAVKLTPTSTAPSAPADGDVWVTSGAGAVMGVRINGASYSLLPKAGTCTLGTNCAAIALPAVMACTCTDQTAFNPCKVTAPSSSVTFNGTGTDVLSYVCVVQQ